MIKARVRQMILEALRKSYPDAADVPFNVSDPSKGIDADLCSNVAISAASSTGGSPISIAHSIAEKIEAAELIKKIDISKNGFLNFFLQDHYLTGLMNAICLEGESFVKPVPESSGHVVMIEFVSANPTGPLHIGHGRGAALGDTLARIYRRLGYKVQSEYYVNDMGVQMAALAESVRAKLCALRGEEGVLFPENGYKGKYIERIAEIMQGEKREDFDRFPREYLLDGIRKDLEDFGVSFDNWFYESTLHKEKKLDEVLEILRSKNRLSEKEGALWFSGREPGSKEEELDKERVLRKSDGKYTYFAADIAYHKNKFERGFTHCIDIWGHDHHGYVPRVEGAVQELGYGKENLKILLYQLVSLRRGGQRVVMSTRAGEFVTLRDILDEVGRDACRFFFAMRNPDSQLEFDVDLAKKQSNENPVYYVQYVHARICSIFKEAERRGIETGRAPSSLKAELEKEERELMVKIGVFADTLEAVVRLSTPNLLTTYMLDLANKFHRFYDKHRVLDAEPEMRDFRFSLLRATQIVVKMGLSLVGVGAPEKM